jgi:hypothetical protein
VVHKFRTITKKKRFCNEILRVVFDLKKGEQEETGDIYMMKRSIFSSSQLVVLG